MPFVFDPTKLLVEIIGLILEYFEVKDKAQLAGVNRAWRDFFNTNTGAWSLLDFGGSTITTEVLELYCVKANYNVTALFMDTCQDDIDIRVLRKCRRLKQLEYGDAYGDPPAKLDENDLAAFPLLQTLTLLPDIMFGLLSKPTMNIINNCPQLKILQLGPERWDRDCLWTASLSINVRIFSLYMKSHSFAVEFGSTLLRNAHSLEDLCILGRHTLADMLHLEKLSSLQLGECDNIGDWQIPTSLRKLKLSDCSGRKLERGLPVMEGLRELSLSRIRSMGRTISSKIMEKVGTKLEVLYLYDIYPGKEIPSDYYWPMEVVSSSPLSLQFCQSYGLRDLVIHASSNNIDRILDIIGSKFLDLRTLVFNGKSVLFKSAVLMNCIEKLPLLESLNLSDHKVEKDIVEVIKKRGIHVTQR